MKVCADCLRTINDHEGRQIVKKIYVEDNEDPNQSLCDFCGNDGFDVLYEIYDDSFIKDSVNDSVTKDELWEMIDALKKDFPDNIQSFEGGNPWTLYVTIKKRPREWPFSSDRFVGEIYLDGEDDCWAKVVEYSMNDAAHKLAMILQRDYQFKDINDYDKYDPWGKP